ncbi:glycoside hydrolase family 16 protein [Curtobacterium sp. VKM Ac-1376]|uniref:glycoside hydrolase family 16 protein n=1 Tax=Curtobacterium sp. VKM Ac-1376 TaxID=123312 RepID=UPI002B272188|nr:glycoside hydrolase family 16 protein [Curtobacterium sp. VKM Ac-1376]
MVVVVAAAAGALAVTAAAVPEGSAPSGSNASADPTAATSPTPSPTMPSYLANREPTYSEDFDTPAAAGGQFAATYRESWQPYPDGTGGKYYSDKLISAHDGYMDVAMDGEHGAAGTFGTPTDAWSHVGGTFSIRARATGGDGNGAAVMLWPTSDAWTDGELNYPEGQFDGSPRVFHHSMLQGLERDTETYNTRVSWRDWHTYTTEWIPGKIIRYYLDGKLVFTVPRNVPTTPHRYMFQIGNWGDPGHLQIDWVRTYDAE